MNLTVSIYKYMSEIEILSLVLDANKTNQDADKVVFKKN
jgi:hypothetical protein